MSKKKKKINVEKLMQQLEEFSIEENQMKSNDTSVYYNYVPTSFFRENKDYLESKEQEIKYLQKEVKACNEFHKNIIRVQDKKIAKLMDCVESIAQYSGSVPIAPMEMKLIALETLKELEGNNE